MAGMTNPDRIIETLRRSPGLDDDELSRIADVRPRQQVNQICRYLESKGVVERVRGEKGKIVNLLVGQSRAAPSTSQSKTQVVAHLASSAPEPARLAARARVGNSSYIGAYVTPDLRSTLMIIPCSGAKAEFPNMCVTGPTILATLPSELAKRLIEARRAAARWAGVDERTCVPAWQRYDGTLYRAVRGELTKSVAHGDACHLMIVSGGYGVVLAQEPIGMYEAVFRKARWPDGLLEEVLVAYARVHGLRSVRAFVSMTTEYVKLIKSVDWGLAGIDDAWLLTPEAGPGAMAKSPRAQGEALAAFLRADLNDSWRSSDDLRLEVMPLSRALEVLGGSETHPYKRPAQSSSVNPAPLTPTGSGCCSDPKGPHPRRSG